MSRYLRTIGLCGLVFALALSLLPPSNASALTVESETGLYSVPQGGRLVFNITSYPNTTLHVSIMHVDKYSFYSFYPHRPLMTDENGTAFMVYSAMCVDEFGKLDLLSDCGLDVPTDTNENDRYIIMISDNETHRKLTIDVTYSQNYQDAVNRAWRERDREDALAFMSSVDLRVNLATYGWPVILLFFLFWTVHVLGIKRIDTFRKTWTALLWVKRKIWRRESQTQDIPSSEEEYRRKKTRARRGYEQLGNDNKEYQRIVKENEERIQKLKDSEKVFAGMEESAKKGKKFADDERKRAKEALEILYGLRKVDESS